MLRMISWWQGLILKIFSERAPVKDLHVRLVYIQCAGIRRPGLKMMSPATPKKRDKKNLIFQSNTRLHFWNVSTNIFLLCILLFISSWIRFCFFLFILYFEVTKFWLLFWWVSLFWGCKKWAFMVFEFSAIFSV